MLSRGESHGQMWSLPAEHTAEGRGHITHSSKSHPHSSCSALSSVKVPFAGYRAHSVSQSSLASRHFFHLKQGKKKKTLPFPKRWLYITLYTPHFSSSDIDGQLDNAFQCLEDQLLHPGKLSPFFEGVHSEQVLRNGDLKYTSHLTPTKWVMKQECQPGAPALLPKGSQTSLQT